MKIAKATATRPVPSTAIFGRSSGPESSRSGSRLTATAGEKLLPRSVERATDTRPAAAQTSHRLPSGAKVGVTVEAQRSVGSAQDGVARRLPVPHLRQRDAGPKQGQNG